MVLCKAQWNTHTVCRQIKVLCVFTEQSAQEVADLLVPTGVAICFNWGGTCLTPTLMEREENQMLSFVLTTTATLALLVILLLTWRYTAKKTEIESTSPGEQATISIQELVECAGDGDLLAYTSNIQPVLPRLLIESLWLHTAIVKRPSSERAGRCSVLEINRAGYQEIPLQCWLKKHIGNGRRVVWRQLTTSASTSARKRIQVCDPKVINTEADVNVDFKDWMRRRLFGKWSPTVPKKLYCTEFVARLLQRAGVMGTSRSPISFIPSEIINLEFDLLPPYQYSLKRVVIGQLINLRRSQPAQRGTTEAQAQEQTWGRIGQSPWCSCNPGCCDGFDETFDCSAKLSSL